MKDRRTLNESEEADDDDSKADKTGQLRLAERLRLYSGQNTPK
jgi:hypothetical protein